MIQVTDNYYIDAADNCFMLYKWDGTFRIRPGKEPEKKNCTITYYSDLVDLMDALSKKLLRDSIKSVTTWDELSQALLDIKKLVASIGKSITAHGQAPAMGGEHARAR